MPKDFLQGARDEYDCIVIGSGLAGMTAANTLARAGHSVLLLEQHYKLGGMATWFKRPGGHIFDISLHGFPVGMIKSCRRYWTAELADSIVQLKNIRFDNPMFSLTTSFDRADFTRQLIEHFKVPAETVQAFFDTARGMNFYDDQQITVGQLFERFFPGREDVIRLLMEPITYANGSTLEDPAISYGIVFSNFMSKGVYTFEGGTDRLIRLMHEELLKSGVDVRIRCDVEKITVANGRVAAVQVNGRTIKTRAIVSNANLKATIFDLVGAEHFDKKFVEDARAVRLNNSSCQVYMALKAGELIDESNGDLLFNSTAPLFRTESLLSRDVTSRTYSFYYPRTRPGSDRCLIVSSTNANYADWANLSEEDYAASKQDLVETTLDALARYVPDIRARLDHAEASTPRTFEHYTKHLAGASFGTKFEGLAVSRAIPEQVRGLYHAGSVGIIMSGWLGAVNYGVIVANDVDALFDEVRTRAADSGRIAMTQAEILAAIPHREPFLLLDEIVERSDQRIVCRKTWRPEEWFYPGHYPNFPITPGVLLCEAAMQAGAVLVAPQLPQDGRMPVVARMQDVRFKRMVKPGDTILLEVEITDRLQDAFYMRARVTCENQLAVRFDFTATLAPVAAFSMTFDFLQLAGRPILVTGVANRKSVAYHIGQLLSAAGAEVLYAVRSPARQAAVAKLLAPAPVYVCDVEFEDQIAALREAVGRDHPRLYGLVHSIAFADYEGGVKPFHETGKREFLRALDISCYSLTALSRAFQDILDPDGAVVAVSISTTRMASENYGYMAPCKAALDSTLVFLAKAFSQFSQVRFNAVAPGLLKTSASAGIPGYVDSYLFAEQATLRKRAVTTEEAAAVAAFLLSPRSSGVNAQNIIVDAGMSVNYFDRDLVRRAMRPE